MRKFLPVLMSSVLMVGGAAAIVLKHGLEEENPVLVEWQGEQDIYEILQQEEDRKIVLEDRMEQIHERLQSRQMTVSLYASGRIDLPRAYSIFEQLTVEGGEAFLAGEPSMKYEDRLRESVCLQLINNLVSLQETEPARDVNRLIQDVLWLQADSQ